MTDLRTRKLRVGAAIFAAALLGIAGIGAYQWTGGSALRRVGEERTLREAIGNSDEIVSAIRKGLREHSRELTIRFSCGWDDLDALPSLAEEWIEEALAETEDPAEGDYIRYQYGGYELSCTRDQTGEVYDYTVSIVPHYYLRYAQEEHASAKVAELMERFDFGESVSSPISDYEKIRTIYDYICANVRYDRVHTGNPNSTLRSTAYAALVGGTATCQGYSVALYRLLREAGIDCRVVTGIGTGEGGAEFHAWNIARLGEEYYALDATWDAGQEEYSYFLKGLDDFPDHEWGEAFRSEGFRAEYPIAAHGYSFP